MTRRNRIDLRLLFRWRRALDLAPATETATFLPVQVADEGTSAPEAREGNAPLSAPSIIVERQAVGIEIELIGGRRVRFDRDVDPETMKRVVAELEGGGP